MWKVQSKKRARAPSNETSGAKKQKKTHTTTPANKQVKLEDLINNKANEIKEKKSQLPELKQLLFQLKQTYESSPSHQIKSYILKIEESIKALENENCLKSYEQKIIPYLQLKQWIQKSGRQPAQQKLQNDPSADWTECNKFDSCELRLQNVIDEYCIEIDEKVPEINIVNMDMCSTCHVPMVIQPNHSCSLCPKCKHSYPYLEATSASIAYGSEVEYSLFTYDKGNHLQEWLNKIQAKESTVISDENLDMVMQQLYENGFTDFSKIQKSDVQKALRQLKATKLYDHLAQIHWKITGVPPPRMTPTQEEVCKFLFRAIQKPFQKIKERLDPTRKNFLSYSFCLYKFCQMMGYTELTKHFPLLKGKEKLEKQNQMFNAIIQDLGWRINPSTGRLLDTVCIPHIFESADGE
jgi:hypothetical protein